MLRLDQLLVHKGLAPSRTVSQKLIAAGQVSIKLAGQWRCVTKASSKYEENAVLRVELGEEQRYVSRAGLKLAGAMDRLKYSPENRLALDVGQSTGGFSDCLIQHGARKVIGVDVGHGQLAKALRSTPEVVCIEGVNARNLDASLFEGHMNEPLFELIVMDVSFISQRLILPALYPLLAPEGQLISLVKPQFELTPSSLGKGGIVKDTHLYQDVEESICGFVKGMSLCIQDYFESSILGGDGNREFFVCAKK